MVVNEDDNFVIHGPPPAEPLLNVTLGTVIHESLLNNPGKHEAMVDAFNGDKLSYQTLLDRSCYLAECLKKSGYGKNTVLSISSENSLEFYVPIIASLFVGAIMAPLNHNYTLMELRHTTNITKPKIIFCSHLIAKKYVDLKKQLPFIEKIIIIDSNQNIEGTQSLLEFERNCLQGEQVLSNRFQPFRGSPNQPAFILCSSGTTGLPKGVMLSHKNIMVRIMHTKDPRYTILTPEDNLLAILPFFHAFGLITNLGALVSGYKIVVHRKFEEDLFLKSIQDYKISVLWLAPPLILFLAKSPKVFNYDLSSLKEVLCGAAPLSKMTEISVQNRLRISSIKQGYGLTEATLAVALIGTHEGRSGSAGKVISYMSCKVRDPETGRSLGPNQVGEICVKGPMVMLGYYENEKATKETFTSDGWLKTGDLGYFDADGYLFIVDRLKELIKYKGFQVAPAELEALLINHPKIRDAGVVGLPDDLSGELPLAFVAKHAGVELTEKEVQDYVAEHLSSQKRLRGGVIFVPEIPKNPSGKILRRELRLMLAKQKSKL